MLKPYYFKTSGLVVNFSLSLSHFLGFSLFGALKFEDFTLIHFLLRKRRTKGTVQNLECYCEILFNMRNIQKGKTKKTGKYFHVSLVPTQMQK